MIKKKKYNAIAYFDDSDNLIRYALILSIIIHALFLIRLSFSNFLLRKKTQNVEITYHKTVVEKIKLEEVKTKRQPVKARQAEVVMEKKNPPQPFIKDISKLMSVFSESKKQPVVEISHTAKLHDININPIKSEEIKIPHYQSYYQVLRGKLEQKLYSNIDFGRSDIGEVYLTFIITSDGNLRQYKIIDTRTKASRYLQDITVKSLLESVPFAPFSADLKYSELPFNIVITFKMME